MRTANDTIIDDSVEIAPFYSNAFHVGTSFFYSIQVIYLTSNAEIKLQCSNDVGRSLSNSDLSRGVGVENWTDVTGSITSVSEDGDITFDVDNVGYKWVRLVMSGTGFITSARINLKGS